MISPFTELFVDCNVIVTIFVAQRCCGIKDKYDPPPPGIFNKNQPPPPCRPGLPLPLRGAEKIKNIRNVPKEEKIRARGFERS